MKNYILFPVICFSSLITAQQHTVTGKITESTTGKPLSGVAVIIQNINAVTNTDKNGIFSLTTGESRLSLLISKAGYESQSLDIQLPLQNELTISLSAKVTEIEEVSLSTGYQKIPKERSTGSFSSVDNKLLQQQVTTNIMDRLPAIANGLTVSKGLTEDGQLMIRGLSTMQGPKNPLIVVDNFPYEGSISNINPNIIESVTILKDAAASSIWGARAANGVIVITTKAAKTSQTTSVEFTANTTLSAKPDLDYSRQISSSDFIDVEMKLFNQGYYDTDLNSANHPALTPVVTILNKEKQGLLSHNDAMNEINRLRNIDVRDQYSKYMYQPVENRQYALNIFGSTPKLSWTSFIGYDDNTGNLSEKYERLNARFQNIWKPTEKLTVTTGMYYTNTTTKSGRSAYNSISMRNNWKVPYMESADDAGNPLVMNHMLDQDYKNSLQGTGLLDWNYYPLTDWMHNTVLYKTNEFILNAGLNYKIIKGLDIDIKYQYQHNNGESSKLYDEQSYYARNYVNNFAKKNTDGSISFVVPKGGIFDKGLSETAVNNLRGQLNYNRNFGKHSISAIAGGEIRETITRYDNNRYYGYNTNTLSTAGMVLAGVGVDIERLKNDVSPPKSTLSAEIRNRIRKNLQKFEDEKEFLKPNLSLKKIAIRVGTNPNYLSSYINTEKGMHFNRYLSELRIKYIAELLAEDPIAVHQKTEVLAKLCGIASRSNFLKLFSEIYGMSLQEYQRQCREKSAANEELN